MSKGSPNKLVYRIGFWSAVIATLSVIASDISMIVSWLVFPPVGGWRGIEAYAASFETAHILSMIPGFFIAVTFAPLMLSIHYSAPEDKKILTHLGLIFTAIYTAIQSINYYVALAVISPNILIGETEGLALFVWANPYSIFIALEGLGYGFMSLATLFVAPIFTKGKLEHSIRWLFIVNGVIGIAGIIGYALNIGYMIILGGLLAWDILFPITTALLAVLFRRIRRTV